MSLTVLSQRSSLAKARWVLACLIAISAAPGFAETDQLVQPRTLIVDRSLPKTQLSAQVLAARRYDTFWNTGDEALARAALDPNFIDGTLSPGRLQGVAGPIVASKTFRGAVPDIHCSVEQMIVAGDRVVSHLHFTGHFTGQFKGTQGHGQTVDFIATDIYRVVNGRIVENWHLEDNLTFLQQIGAITK